MILKKKLEKIVLIDDDESTNFLHERLLTRKACAKDIAVFQSAEKALDYLRTGDTSPEKPDPVLIFLDINMPRMDGWEFLECYRQLQEQRKPNYVVIMLTTSLNPDDRHRANAIEEVAGFYSKPLTPEILDEVLHVHFGAIEE